jgi:hypothetical protein
MDNSLNETPHLNKLKLGVFSHFMIVVSITFYILSFNNNFNYAYYNIPYFTLLNLEVYRIITSIFISDSIYELIFHIIVISTIFNYLENTEGTIKFFIKFSWNVFIFQCMMLLIYFLYSTLFNSSKALSYIIEPLPAIGISFLIKQMLTSEEKYISFYQDYIKINTRWMFLFTIITFMLINYHEIKWEGIMSLYFGFLMCKFYKYLNYHPDEEKIISFEKYESMKFLFNLDGWILLESCLFKEKTRRKSDNIDQNIINNGNSGSLGIMESDHIDLSDNTDINLIIDPHIDNFKLEKFEKEDNKLELEEIAI